MGCLGASGSQCKWLRRVRWAAVMTASGRAQEIHAWLYVNAMVDRWAVLDDNHVDVDPSRFVRTNPSIGLTDADVERAIAILTRPA